MRLVLGLMMALAATAAAAQDAAALPPLKVCFAEWPPYAHLKDGKPTGTSIDILTEAARRIGRQAQFDQVAWNDCLEMTRAGRYDATAEARPRDGYFLPKRHIAVYIYSVWVRQDDPLRAYQGLPALAGRSLGLVKSYVHPEEIFQIKDLKIVRVDADRTLGRTLQAGRVEAILADQTVMTALLREEGWKIRPLKPAVTVERLFPLFNSAQAELGRQIDEAVLALWKDGGVDAAYRTHTGSSFAQIRDAAGLDKGL